MPKIAGSCSVGEIRNSKALSAPWLGTWMMGSLIFPSTFLGEPLASVTSSVAGARLEVCCKSAKEPVHICIEMTCCRSLPRRPLAVLTSLCLHPCLAAGDGR